MHKDSTLYMKMKKKEKIEYLSKGIALDDSTQISGQKKSLSRTFPTVQESSDKL